MVDPFKAFIQQEALAAERDRILLGVSGGLDSVAMAHLFHRSGYTFGLAHCHFGLRGEEADADAAFVKELAEQLSVPFYQTTFDTSKYANEHGTSIQMAARELRYDWFEVCRQAQNYNWVAVGSHSNDATETLLINLVRGTGLAGLHGITPKKDKIIRPLLFAQRDELHRWAQQEGISWREDSSNASNDYWRNRIRNQVIPELKKLNPRLDHSMQANICRFRDTETIFQQAIERARKQCMREEGQSTIIELESLKSLQPIHTYLFELLRPFGFQNPVVSEITAALDRQAGTRFFSASHQLTKDRDTLIITLRQEEELQPVFITAETQEIQSPVALTFAKAAAGITIEHDPNTAYLDLDRLTFPLTLRRWKAGDSFQPLGMKGSKKISDFLIDQKVPLPHKKEVLLLCSGNAIVYVLGHRPDERFKVGDHTKNIYIVQVTKQA